MPKVIRVSFSDKVPGDMVAVVLQEASLVLDLTDEFKTKRTITPIVIQLPKDLLEFVELDELMHR